MPVHTFFNEKNNEIVMSVRMDDRGVTIKAVGPDSVVENTWTPLEVAVMFKLVAGLAEEIIVPDYLLEDL